MTLKQFRQRGTPELRLLAACVEMYGSRPEGLRVGKAAQIIKRRASFVRTTVTRWRTDMEMFNDPMRGGVRLLIEFGENGRQEVIRIAKDQTSAPHVDAMHTREAKRAQRLVARTNGIANYHAPIIGRLPQHAEPAALAV